MPVENRQYNDGFGVQGQVSHCIYPIADFRTRPGGHGVDGEEVTRRVNPSVEMLATPLISAGIVAFGSGMFSERSGLLHSNHKQAEVSFFPPLLCYLSHQYLSPI